MTTLYAESSAVLRWLLGTSDADRIERELTSAPAVVTSELTSAEVGRSLQRLVTTGQIVPEEGERAWASYTVASQHWHVYDIGEPVLLRVRQPFPHEPVRTLDAIHLATALYHALEVAPPVLLTVDRQVRANGQALGLAVAP